ncbi:MAG TPA: hypothetical protein PKD34_00510 [Candidatus Doudnabacteria bacterium]|nr:hypothetical protein [Candidatus Doudnabacteria bacterium]
MPENILSLIVNLLFYISVGAFTLLSLLAIYILIKYGRTPAITVFASLAYSGVFLLSFIGALITLQLAF